MRRLGGGVRDEAARKNVEKDEALVVVRCLRHRLARRTRADSMLWRRFQTTRTASGMRIVLVSKR